MVWTGSGGMLSSLGPLAEEIDAGDGIGPETLYV